MITHVVTRGDPLAVAATNEAIELVGEQVERFVSIVAGLAGDQIGAADLNVPLGDEFSVLGLGFIVFDIEPDADDMIIMSE